MEVPYINLLRVVEVELVEAQVASTPPQRGSLYKMGNKDGRTHLQKEPSTWEDSLEIFLEVPGSIFQGLNQ